MRYGNKSECNENSKESRKDILKYSRLTISQEEVIGVWYFIFHILENNKKLSNLESVYSNLPFLSNIMSLKSYIFILFIITCTSIGSIGLLLFYMNPIPEDTRNIAFYLMWWAIFLAGSSILAPILFFIKKIYYRWDVSILTMNASVRQSILLTLWFLAMIILYYFRIFEPRLIAMIWLSLWCLEVMIQAIE